MIAIFFKIRSTKVSDQGLAALGSSFKDLNSLSHLSLYFRDIVKDYFSKIKTYLHEVFCGCSRKAMNLSFAFYPLFSHFLFYAKDRPFLIAINLKNRSTQVSDQGHAALGSSLKKLRSLTNLSLNFGYFFKD